MRIALLSYEYPPETGFGGIGTYTHYQAHALTRLGHEVTVFSGAKRPLRSRAADGSVTVIRNWTKQRLGPLASSRTHELGWFNNRLDTAVNMYASLRRELEAGQFDIVEMPECGAEGALVNTMLDLPTVVRLHSPAELIMPTYNTGQVDRMMTATMERMALSGARAVTSCSHWLAKAAIDTIGIRQPIQVIPNGLDLRTFDADEGIDICEKWGIPRDATKIFFANRLEPRKGTKVLEEICAPLLKQFEDLVIVLAGADLDGWFERELQATLDSDELRSRVIAIGRISQSEVRACLKQTDIFLLASIWENAPYSLLEAMAAERAIVASDCGGIPEMLRHGLDGLVAATGQADSFQRSLEKLLAARNLRERLGRSARQRVESRFTDVTMAERSLDYYSWVLGSSRSGGTADTAGKEAVRASAGKQTITESNWFFVRWLAGGNTGSIPTVFDAAGDAPLAKLGLDELAFVKHTLTRTFWSSAFRDHDGFAAFIKELDQLYRDTALARSRDSRSRDRKELVYPAANHVLFDSDKAVSTLASEAWRVETSPTFSAWIARCAGDDAFRERALRSIATRHLLIRGTRRKATKEGLDALRWLYRSPAHRTALLTADEQAFESETFGKALRGDIAELGLHAPMRRPRVFGRKKANARKAGDNDEASVAEVTVLIPSYNHERYIAAAMQSALEQTVATRVLVADDGSSDGTFATASSLKDPRVVVKRNEHNLGLGRSIAAALDTIDTEFVAILNSDDLFHPKRLERCLEVLTATDGAEVAATALQVMDPSDAALTAESACITDVGPRALQWLRWYESYCAGVELTPGDPPSEQVDALLAANFLVSSSNIVCRTSWLRDRIERVVPLRYCLDWRIFLDAALEGSLAYIAEPLLGYRLHDSNTVWFEGEMRHDYVHEVNFVIAETLKTLAANHRQVARNDSETAESQASTPATTAEELARLLTGPVRAHGEADANAIAWSLLAGRPLELGYSADSAAEALTGAATRRREVQDSVGSFDMPAWQLAERLRRSPHLEATEHLAFSLLPEQKNLERQLEHLRAQLRDARNRSNDLNAYLKRQQALEERIAELQVETTAAGRQRESIEQRAGKLEQDLETEQQAAKQREDELRRELSSLEIHVHEERVAKEAAERSAESLRAQGQQTAEHAAALKAQLKTAQQARAGRLARARTDAIDQARSIDRARGTALRNMLAGSDATEGRLSGPTRLARFVARKVRPKSPDLLVVPLPADVAWANRTVIDNDLRHAAAAGFAIRFLAIPFCDPALDRAASQWTQDLTKYAAVSSRLAASDQAAFADATGEKEQALLKACRLNALAFSIAREVESLAPAAVLALDLQEQGALAALTASLCRLDVVTRVRGMDLLGYRNRSLSLQILEASKLLLCDSPATAQQVSLRSKPEYLVLSPAEENTASPAESTDTTVAMFGPLTAQRNPAELVQSLLALHKAGHNNIRLDIATAATPGPDELEQRTVLLDRLSEHGLAERTRFSDGIGAGAARTLASRAALILDPATDGADFGATDGAALAIATQTPFAGTHTESLLWLFGLAKPAQSPHLGALKDLPELACTAIAAKPSTGSAPPPSSNAQSWTDAIERVRSWH